MRVLVTGAAGLLGSATVAALLAEQHEVLALVRDMDPRSRLARLRGFVEVRGELEEARRVLARYRPEAVIHLAAQSQVPLANRDPLPTFEANVRGTWILLDACREHRPEAILVASSDKAYGSAPLPYREDGPLQPSAPYDVSKACTDLIARSYADHFGLPIAVTRCGNLYGPGDLNEQRLVPGVIAALRRGEPPRMRSTGNMSREWLFVEDAARALLLLLRRPAGAWNVGGGEVARVADVVRELVRLSGVEVEPVFSATDPAGEIPDQALDSGKLRAAGWAPRVGLREGLELCWEAATSPS